MGLKNRLEYTLKHNAFIYDCYKIVCGFALRVLGLFIKTEDSLVLFTAQAKRFNDSPKAIYLYMVEHGMTDKISQEMLDNQTRVVVNMLKQYSDMSELQSVLNPSFDIKRAISDDMLSYLAVGSLFSLYDNNYDRYAVYLLNEIFNYSDGRYTVADLKKCLWKENLDNVLVNGDMTKAGLDQMNRFETSFREGFIKLYPLLNAKDSIVPGYVNQVYIFYQLYFQMLLGFIETGRTQNNYRLIKHYYVYVNNCICQLFNGIPGKYLTDDFVNYYKRVSSEVNRMST